MYNGIDVYVYPLYVIPKRLRHVYLFSGRVFRHTFTSSRSRGDVVTNITAGRINYYTSQRLTAVDLSGAVVNRDARPACRESE